MSLYTDENEQNLSSGVWEQQSADQPAHPHSLIRAFVIVNNKGADQPGHPHSLISTFVIRLLKSIISKLATSKISIFLLVSVAEETG